MTQEKFKKARKLWEEMDRLDFLIKQLEDRATLNPDYSDYAYFVHLLGEDDVLGFMRTRKRIVEKEFEDL
jgi:hypothetical protein